MKIIYVQYFINKKYLCKITYKNNIILQEFPILKRSSKIYYEYIIWVSLLFQPTSLLFINNIIFF